MGAFIDMYGKKFGRLTVVSRTANSKNREARWNCLCDCGEMSTPRGSDLRRGTAASCGCLSRERSTTHGMRNSGAYQSWKSMRSRCSNQKHNQFSRYGGRGIKICERWSTFAAFFEDMGSPPPGHTLDRIDNDGNYESSNCRWATQKEQQRNRSSNVYLEVDGDSKLLIEWSEILGIPYSRICWRRCHNWPDDEVLFGRNLVDKPRLLPKIKAARLERQCT